MHGFSSRSLDFSLLPDYHTHCIGLVDFQQKKQAIHEKQKGESVALTLRNRYL